MSPTDVRKVVIIGTSGCGKTTLGEEISKHIHAKFVDLDDLYWLPGLLYFSTLQAQITPSKVPPTFHQIL